MLYKEIYEILKERYTAMDRYVAIDELSISISKVKFVSDRCHYLLGAKNYECSEHNASFKETFIDSASEVKEIYYEDSSLLCNKEFNYYIVAPTKCSSKNAIVLFHGFNEKNWLKYLPWAYKLAINTGRAVVLFPTAFHMDRALPLWSDSHIMQKVSDERKNKANNFASSFVNAAISSRIESNPQRIFWSGCQTLGDFKKFIGMIRNGEIPQIESSANINLFGYSIGAYFSLFLMMANPDNELANSKFFAFCGGCTLDRMFPVSKYIMDLRASFAIQNYFAEQGLTGFESHPRIKHFLNESHNEEKYFNMIFQYQRLKALRESRISEICENIYAIALEKDTVAPSDEILNTLKGAYRNINSKVDILDYNHPYDHITPFTLNAKMQNEIDYSFNITMDKASEFLK